MSTPLGCCRYYKVDTDELDDLSATQRFAFWRNTCLKSVEPAEAPAGSYHRFRARSQGLVGNAGSFADNSVVSVRVQRTPRLCAQDGIDNIVLSLEIGRGGSGRVGVADKSVLFAPGRLYALDYREPLAADWAQGMHHGLLLNLPRAIVLAALGRQPADLIGVPLSGGLVPLLVEQLRSLAPLLPSLEVHVRAAALQATLDLALTTLCIWLGAAKPDSDVCQDGMLVAAQALISRRFASTDLSPAEIAQRLGCSRAHLYRIFARNGLTVAGYLRETRLQRSHAALAAAAPRETVADIAFRCGFENPVHFTHLFRQRFGICPSDARPRPRHPSPAGAGSSGAVRARPGAR